MEPAWRTRRQAEPARVTSGSGGRTELKRLVYAFGMAGELALPARLLHEEAVEAPAWAMSA
jgi:hypothetical protein